jgi:hypothetical protein
LRPGQRRTNHPGRQVYRKKDGSTVKVTDKVHTTTCQRGSRRIPLLFFNLGAGLGWMVNGMPRPLNPRERHPVPTVQEDGWVYTGVENLALTAS